MSVSENRSQLYKHKRKQNLLQSHIIQRLQFMGWFVAHGVAWIAQYWHLCLIQGSHTLCRYKYGYKLCSLLAELFLFPYEYRYMQKILSSIYASYDLANVINCILMNCLRNNSCVTGALKDIIPTFPGLWETTASTGGTPYLDVHLYKTAAFLVDILIVSTRTAMYWCILWNVDVFPCGIC